MIARRPIAKKSHHFRLDSDDSPGKRFLIARCVVGSELSTGHDGEQGMSPLQHGSARAVGRGVSSRSIAGGLHVEPLEPRWCMAAAVRAQQPSRRHHTIYLDFDGTSPGTTWNNINTRRSARPPIADGGNLVHDGGWSISASPGKAYDYLPFAASDDRRSASSPGAAAAATRSGHPRRYHGGHGRAAPAVSLRR
jgi:hypothetical protein